MLVSIIIPVYNVEKYIEKCLRSLLNQAFEEYEIIVVIDGSTDASEKIVRDFQKVDPKRIKIICQEKKGPGAARNAGIAAADGDYLLFVDSDDYVSPDLLAHTYEKAVENDSDIIIFDANLVDEYGKHLKYESATIYESDMIKLDGPGRLLILPCLWNKLYKKSLFSENGILILENSAMGEDFAANMKLLSSTEKITYLPEPLYFYVQHSGSIMSSSQNDIAKIMRNRDIITSMNSVIDYFKKTGKYNEYFDELEYLILCNVLFRAALRVNECDYGSELQAELVNYTVKKYPHFEKNKYYKQLLSKKEKTIIYFLKHKRFRTLHFVLRLNRKLQGR